MGDGVAGAMGGVKIVVRAGGVREGVGRCWRGVGEGSGMYVCKARALGLLLVCRRPAAIRVLVAAHPEVLRVRLLGRGRRAARGSVAEVGGGRERRVGERRRRVRGGGVVGVQAGLLEGGRGRERRGPMRRVRDTHGRRRSAALGPAHGT